MEDEEELLPPAKPSRKALGKRRVVDDVDSGFRVAWIQRDTNSSDHFNPDDMFGGPPKRPSSDSSHESVTADDVYNVKPVTYVYDAYQEKLKEEVQVERSRNVRRDTDPVRGGGGGGSGSAMLGDEVEAR